MAADRHPLRIDEPGRATASARTHARVYQADAGTAPPDTPDLRAHAKARCQRKDGAMGVVPASAGRTETKAGGRRQREKTGRESADAEPEQDQDRAAD